MTDKDMIINQIINDMNIITGAMKESNNIDHEGFNKYILRLNKLIKVLNPIDKRIKNEVFQDNIKDAIKEAILILHDIELSLMKAKNPGIDIIEINDFWVMSSEIKDIIINHELIDLKEFDTNNINSMIGKILSSMGFIEIKRSSKGNLRKIDIKSL